MSQNSIGWADLRRQVIDLEVAEADRLLRKSKIQDFPYPGRKIGEAITVQRPAPYAPGTVAAPTPFASKEMPAPKNKCESPRCSAEGVDLHVCPYASEINNDDESLCNCCDGCAYQCGRDI